MFKRVLLAGFAMLAVVPAARAADAKMDTKTSVWGFDLAGRDTSVTPGADFYQYANGTAVRNLVIPPDRTNWGSFIMLRDLSEQRVHGILDDAAARVGGTGTGSTGPVAKTGAFYRAYMDDAAVEKLGAAPLAPALAAIRAAKTPADVATLMGNAQKDFNGSLFGVGVGPDDKNPAKYTIQLGQSGLGMPDRDYYLEKSFADKRAKYAVFIEHMLTLAGWPDAKASAANVLAFETKVAQASWSRTQQRDPDKLYNVRSLDDLAKTAPGFDWAAYFKAADLGAPARLIVGEPDAVSKIAALAGSTPIETLRAWAAFHLVINAAPVLSHAFADANFDFFAHDLQGQPQQRPRWKRAGDATEAALGEAIGQAYVEKYFTPVARRQMAQLTRDLRDAFHVRLEHNTWMSPATRASALGKLASFDFQIGYPKKWRSYAKLKVSASDLYGNIAHSTAFDWAYQVSHLPKAVDRDEWGMFPQTVNAYNAPNFNQVVFPAAILQPPFFDASADAAINYGAIGGVIGHEMTHSFDDQGRKYDAHGELKNWWTAEDIKRFEVLSKKYGAQFAAMDILPGAHINPDLTMGENIADLGGLTLALDAYVQSLHGKPSKVIDGLTGEQRVFLGWAQVWRAKVRDDAARQRLVVDPHSPPVARVNGPIRNVEGFYTAFGIKAGDKMYLAPADRVIIW